MIKTKMTNMMLFQDTDDAQIVDSFYPTIQMIGDDKIEITGNWISTGEEISVDILNHFVCIVLERHKTCSLHFNLDFYNIGVVGNLYKLYKQHQWRLKMLWVHKQENNVLLDDIKLLKEMDERFPLVIIQYDE